MERLTFEGNFCDIAMCRENPCPYNGSCSQKETWERLKAYEDTGLDPEHAAAWEKNRRNSVTIGRMAEILEAESEGRLMVLPFKVGDWVYALWSVPTASRYVVYCAEVKEICFSVRNCRLTATYRLEPIEYRGRRKEYFAEDIGKTVFLTREEAEAALKGEGNG